MPFEVVIRVLTGFPIIKRGEEDEDSGGKNPSTVGEIRKHENRPPPLLRRFPSQLERPSQIPLHELLLEVLFRRRGRPLPTIFIGGNHEASNYLWELYYGGWAAPNIYILRAAGVVRFGNFRIGGLSGIYKSFDYKLGHFERPPYDHNTIKSVYHVCEYDVRKLMQVKELIDVFLSHDWPVRITDHGDWRELIEEKRLGSKPAAELLEKLKPHYWFSAHLHCKFATLVQHGEGGPLTKFLVLDKCIAGCDFLQIVEIESDAGPYEIQCDEEWLAITRKFNHIFPLTYKGADFRGINLEMEDCLEWVRSRLQERGCKPFEFVRSAPLNPQNPQTESFLRLLELPYLLDRNPEAKDLSPYPSPSI
ncbi:Lariat debranching enzyme [Glycine soja]